MSENNTWDTLVTNENLMQWTRGELEEFSRIWHNAIDACQKSGNNEPMKKFFKSDAEAIWCVPGIKPSYFHKQKTAVGPDAIVDAISRNELLGIKGWKRPWTECIIDSHKGVIIYFWDEISPYMKKDGTPFKTNTFGTTRLEYAGSYQISKMEIIEDPEYRVALIDELIAAGFASTEMIQKQNAYYNNLEEDRKQWNAHLAELERTKPGIYGTTEQPICEMDTAQPVIVNETPNPAPVSAAMPASELRKNDTLAKAEHEAVRNHVGYYDFTHKLLEVTGVDARGFLSKMFVGAIAKAKIGSAKYTTMLNEDGIIIDDVIVFRMAEDTFWVSTLYIDELIAWFDAHRTFEEISYHEITGITTMYAVQGPDSGNLLNDFLEKPVTEMKLFQIRDNAIGSVPVRIARSGYTGELGYEIYCNPKDSMIIESILEKFGQKYGIMKITTDVIVSSLPREKGFVLMSDLAGTNPLEAGFDWSIDWNKRFIGKSALLKVKENGAEKSLLGFVSSDDTVDIEPDTPVILNGEKVGKVTVSTYGFTVKKMIGFALVDNAKAKIGDVASVTVKGQNIPINLCERMFYRK